MYYIFVENNEICGAGECPVRNSNIKNLEVTKEIFNNFSEDPEKYVFENNQIIENPDYSKLKKEKEIRGQIQDIIAKLDSLDIKRIRAVCENEIKDAETGETWIEYYNSKIKDLRNELSGLQSQL